MAVIHMVWCAEVMPRHGSIIIAEATQGNIPTGSTASDPIAKQAAAKMAPGFFPIVVAIVL